MKPILQVALDFIELPRAISVAEDAVAGGVDWIEVGTPLIKSVGVESIRELHRRFPQVPIVADMKTMDVGRIEVEMAAKSGATVVNVLGVAPLSTIQECIAAAANLGVQIMVDLFAADDEINLAERIERLGANYISIHTAIDDQMQGLSSFIRIKELAQKITIPLAVAGGINSETASAAVESGASIIIVGGAITKSVNVRKSTEQIKTAINKMVVIESEVSRRVTGEKVYTLLRQVSTANVSDAMHRVPVLTGIRSRCPGTKLVGKVITVRTSPGDWAKPVEAIDIAQDNNVIIVDAGGVGPAVWGELASQSAKSKNLAGVVVNGAVRDVIDIQSLSFPVFSKLTTAQAGEPRGWGEINVPLTIAGTKIRPGDWVVGDDDGVIVIPQKVVTEIANRALEVLEKETRIRQEILQGGTLGKITELLKWEKK